MRSGVFGAKAGFVEQDRARDDARDLGIVECAQARMRHAVAVMQNGFDDPGIEFVAHKALAGANRIAVHSAILAARAAAHHARVVDFGMQRIWMALLAGTLAAATPAAAQELRRTDERHLQRQFDPVGPQMLETARSPESARPRPVLLRSPKSLAELGKYDAKASAACRARDFGQFEQHRATVVLAGKT